jgi:hypothetical protein
MGGSDPFGNPSSNNMNNNLMRGSGFDNNQNPNNPMGMSKSSPQPKEPHNAAPSTSHETQMMSKNIEIIVSKLDAIRTAIENLDHRMNIIESSINEKAKKDDYGKW